MIWPPLRRRRSTRPTGLPPERSIAEAFEADWRATQLDAVRAAGRLVAEVPERPIQVSPKASSDPPPRESVTLEEFLRDPVAVNDRAAEVGAVEVRSGDRLVAVICVPREPPSALATKLCALQFLEIAAAQREQRRVAESSSRQKPWRRGWFASLLHWIAR